MTPTFLPDFSSFASAAAFNTLFGSFDAVALGGKECLGLVTVANEVDVEVEAGLVVAVVLVDCSVEEDSVDEGTVLDSASLDMGDELDEGISLDTMLEDATELLDVTSSELDKVSLDSAGDGKVELSDVGQGAKRVSTGIEVKTEDNEVAVLKTYETLKGKSFSLVYRVELKADDIRCLSR